MNWYFYINWGSGYVLVSPSDLESLELKWKRGDLNDFIQRKELEGSFTLTGTDFTNAVTYFVTNGNYEAPIRIYQNGDSGTGTLKYEGWLRKTGEFNYRESKVIFDTFRTNDQYEGFIPHMKNNHLGEDLTFLGSNPVVFAAQGQNSNSSKLHSLTFSGTSFTYIGSLAVPNLGKCSITNAAGSEFAVFDNVNDTLKGYTSSGSSFVENRSRSFGGTRFGYRISAEAAGTGTITFLTDNGFFEGWQQSGTSYSNVPGVFADAPYMKNPKFANGLMVDEALGAIQTTNGKYSFSVGDMRNPAICVLDSGTNAYCYVDASQQKLIAFTYSSGTFTELDSVQLFNLYEPAICYYSSNIILLHDTISGTLKAFQYSGGTLAQLGSSYSIGGGYSSSVCVITGTIMLAISDTYVFRSSITHSYYYLVNNLLYNESIYGASSPNYILQAATTSGSDIDVDDFRVGDVRDLYDNRIDAGTDNSYKYNLRDALQYFEDLFQNFWYIDSNYKIKFTQPDQFSSFGTTFNISSLDLVTEMNQRTYNDSFSISQEELVLVNSRNQDFFNNKIVYNRNTPIENIKNVNFTTDLQQLINVFTGQSSIKIERSGLFAYIHDSSIPGAASGTGIISGSDTKNYLMSQSQLYNDYFKDYRYQEQGNITINGSSSAVQNTVRNIIEFPEIKVSQGDLSITEFPSEVSSLNWGSSVLSFITEYSHNLETEVITINSRLLDI